MSGLKLPAVAAAGLAAVVALGGVSAAAPAAADTGGTSSAAADPAGSAAADPLAGTDGGTDTGSTDPGTDVGADAGAGAGTDAAADPLAGAGTGTDSGTDSAVGAAGVAGSAGSDPSAAAADPLSAAGADAVDVSPASVAPGGRVTIHLSVSCSSGHKAKASAAVFVDSITLAPASTGGGLEGSAFIKSDAVTGSYAVSVQCDGAGSSAKASITVTGSTTRPVTPVTPVTPDKPVFPVPAGGGGTAQLAAGPAAAGSSTGPLVITGAFAAVGLTGLALRRRRTPAGDRG